MMRSVSAQPSSAETSAAAGSWSRTSGCGVGEFGRGKIGRVADDEVEAFVGANPGKPVGTPKINASGEVACHGVFARKPQRVVARIHGDHPGTGEEPGEGERKCTAAGAKVEHGGRRCSHGVLDEFDQLFRLRARDKHAPVDLEREIEKRRAAEHVGERFALPTTAHQGTDHLEFRITERPLELQVDLHAADVESVRDDQLGIEPRAFDPVFPEELGGALDDVEKGQHENGQRTVEAASAAMRAHNETGAAECPAQPGISGRNGPARPALRHAQVSLRLAHRPSQIDDTAVSPIWREVTRREVQPVGENR